MKYSIGLMIIFFIVACSENKQQEPEKLLEHQLESYKKAQQVETLLIDRVNEQKNNIEMLQ